MDSQSKLISSASALATAAQTVLTFVSSPTRQPARPGSSSATNSSMGVAWEEVVPGLSQHTEDALPDVAAKVVELEKQGKGRKIIAYSLFGNNPKYTQVGRASVYLDAPAFLCPHMCPHAWLPWLPVARAPSCVMIDQSHTLHRAGEQSNP
jgi:hypothetical protein